MRREEVAKLVIAGWFAFWGSWPFMQAHHGDGSVTTQLDYFCHAAGVFYLIYALAVWVFVDEEDL